MEPIYSGSSNQDRMQNLKVRVFNKKFNYVSLDFPFKLKCFKIITVYMHCYFILLEKAFWILNMLDGLPKLNPLWKI